MMNVIVVSHSSNKALNYDIFGIPIILKAGKYI